MGLQLRCHRLQSDAAAEAVGGVGMSAPPNCQLNRRRRTGRNLRSPSSCYLCALAISAVQSALFFNGLLDLTL
jgi:hypothetical protein